MRVWTILVAGAAVGVAGLAGMRAAASPEDPAPAAGNARPAGACVAFVNLNRAFQAHPGKKKLEETLQGDLDAINTSMESRKAELRKEAQDLEARFSPGTPEYQQGLKRIDLKKFEAEYEGKAALDLLRRKQVTGMASAYREIVAEAERIAGEKGYSAVASFDDEPLTVEDKGGQMATPNDLKFQIALRGVLWASPEVDITKDVIAALGK